MAAGRWVIGAALAAGLVLPALAQTVDGASARRLLFPPGRVEVVVRPEAGLTQAEAQVLGQVAQQNVPYYGAIAISRQDGVGHAATSATGNYHDVPSAAAAALAACNANRSRGAAACVIAVEIRPRGWQARALQFSASASASFRRDYQRGRGEKAFAVSPSTGGFGTGRGAGAAASALAACNAAGGAGDCRVVVAD